MAHSVFWVANAERRNALVGNANQTASTLEVSDMTSNTRDGTTCFLPLCDCRTAADLGVAIRVDHCEVHAFEGTAPIAQILHRIRVSHNNLIHILKIVGKQGEVTAFASKESRIGSGRGAYHQPPGRGEQYSHQS